jgi:hypothetical protein
MAYKGLRDVPIERIEDENLDIKPYIESLSQFIMECDTPMTIAIQGDWGSGKTSMMNLVRANIEVRYPGQICPIWFNTWQYSQFNAQDQLGIALLTRFAHELSGRSDTDEVVKKVIGGIGKVAKTIGRNAIFMGTMAFTGSAEGAKDAQGAVDDIFQKDFVQSLTDLKNDIVLMTSRRLKSNGKDRVVVFIDDLDRLVPERAVELLEVFKLFLDVPGCVFVLACDYQVIAQGLKKKFDIDEHDLKGKSFFDKIIQLPFSMPVGQYDTRSYTADLLNKIGVKTSDNELEMYCNLISSSVGLNPRSMKRLFNSFQLITLAAEHKGILQDTDAAKRHERQRILLACLCLQTAFEPAYRYLTAKGALTESDIEDLREFDADNQKEQADLVDEMGGQNSPMMRRVPGFISAFVAAIQLDSDGSEALSDAELNNLAAMLAFSSITSTAKAEALIGDEDRTESTALKKFLAELAAEINEAHGKELKKLGARMLFDPKTGAKSGKPWGLIEARLQCVPREIVLRCRYRGREKTPYAVLTLSSSDSEWCSGFVSTQLRDVVGLPHVDKRGEYRVGHVEFADGDPLPDCLRKFREMALARLKVLLPRLAGICDHNGTAKVEN